MHPAAERPPVHQRFADSRHLPVQEADMTGSDRCAPGQCRRRISPSAILTFTSPSRPMTMSSGPRPGNSILCRGGMDGKSSFCFAGRTAIGAGQRASSVRQPGRTVLSIVSPALTRINRGRRLLQHSTTLSANSRRSQTWQWRRCQWPSRRGQVCARLRLMAHGFRQKVALFPNTKFELAACKNYVDALGSVVDRAPDAPQTVRSGSRRRPRGRIRSWRRRSYPTTARSG